MIQKIFTLVLISSAAYWYWNGPYQDNQSASYDEQVEANAQDMARCVRAQKFASNYRSSKKLTTEQTCAHKYNLYQDGGHWHRYDGSRAS